jgi:DNA-directed RNA polymerase specialized sigma subunit
MPNPLEEALDLLGYEEEEDMDKEGFAAFQPPKYGPQTPISGIAKQELQMWQQWNQGGKKPEDLRPLVQSLQPVVNNRLKIFQNRVRDIPPDTIRAEFHDRLIHALDTYDPNRGKMTTWINAHMMKANRFVTTYQNPARIGEKRIGDITAFNTAEDTLRNRLGRSPTIIEISDYAKIPQNEVKMLRTELRGSHPVGQFGEKDPTSFTMSRTQEIMNLLPHDLTTEERAVFEYVHGVAGKPQLGTGAIAQKLSMSAPKVSRIKQAIATKWRQYDGG